mgnify:FL=1
MSRKEEKMIVMSATMPDEMIRRIDAVRGYESRSSWIRRVLEDHFKQKN